MAPTLIQTGYGERRGQAPRALDLHRPLGTIVAGGSKHALVAAFISKHYKGVVGHGVERPIGTITAHAGGNHALTAAWLTKYYGEARHGSSLEDPMPTVLSGGDRGGGHAALTTAFLKRYAGPDASSLVTVDGLTYQINDLGMRMLQPDELLRAQGFSDDYDLSAAVSQTDKIRLIGNSVCPQMAEAIVAANMRAA